MKQRRSHLYFLFSFIVLIAFTIPDSVAQSDLELYHKYVDKSEVDLSTSVRATSQLGEVDYNHISLHDNSIKEIIRQNRQSEIFTAFLNIEDATDLVELFTDLQQLPNLEAIILYDYGSPGIKRKYQLPDQILNLKSLKFFKIQGASNLDARNSFEKFRNMPWLRGIDLADYTANLPVNFTLPSHISFVRLLASQLQSINITGVSWRMVTIESEFGHALSNQLLLEKLAAIKSIEWLKFTRCHIEDGTVFEKFNSLKSLKIKLIVAKDAKLIESLSALKYLKELSFDHMSDTSQSFKALGMLTNLESLTLKGIVRFNVHPNELMAVAKLTKLRMLDIQQCGLVIMPDFFKSLTRLESFTFKWNTPRWTNESAFRLPQGLYKLPALQTLIVWRSISEVPSLKNLKELKSLDLKYNNINHIPEGLSALKHLKSLDFKENKLTDVNKTSWAELKALEMADFSNNLLNEFPNGLQHLSQLKFLDLSQNKISYYPKIENIAHQLEVLLLNYNPLKNLPSNIHHYANLQMLSAYDCLLTTLPDNFGKLKELRVLNLQGNHLQALPAGLANNLNLKELNLSRNFNIDEQSVYRVVFNGLRNRGLNANLSSVGMKKLPIDVPWGQMKLSLDLSDNQLISIPKEITEMKQLHLIVKGNPLNVTKGLLNLEISNLGDAKLLFEELGYSTADLKVDDKVFAASLRKAVRLLYDEKSYEKAVEYANKSIALDPKGYKENVHWFPIGMSRYYIKDYPNAIEDLNNQIAYAYKRWWDTNMAKETETALSDAYLQLGDKRKAAETHGLFSRENREAESALNAALGYMELGEAELSKQYLNNAVQYSNMELKKYGHSRDIFIPNHMEILLMAGQTDEVINIAETENPRTFARAPANKDYLETVARMIKYPADHQKLRSNYIFKLAKNGKVKDWDYTKFNQWVKYSTLSDKLKRQIQELEVLNN